VPYATVHCSSCWGCCGGVCLGQWQRCYCCRSKCFTEGQAELLLAAICLLLALAMLLGLLLLLLLLL